MKFSVDGSERRRANSLESNLLLCFSQGFESLLQLVENTSRDSFDLFYASHGVKNSPRESERRKLGF